MLSGLRFFRLLPLAALLACSSTPGGSIANGFTTGDYVLTVAPGTAGAGTLVGALTVAGTAVSGVFRFNLPGNACVSSTQDIAFTGPIVNNVLTLVSGSFSGSVATVTIQLPLLTNTSGIENGSGTILIAGGPCALASSPLVASFPPTYNGTWNGALTGPANGNVTLTLSVGTANTDGQFPTTGTVSFSSPTCSFSAPVALSGLVSGYSLQLSANGIQLPAGAIGITASTANFPATVSMNVTAVPGTCLAGTYTGTIVP